MVKPAPVATNVVARFAYPLRKIRASRAPAGAASRSLRTARRSPTSRTTRSTCGRCTNSRRSRFAAPTSTRSISTFSPDGQSIAFFVPGPGGTLERRRPQENRDYRREPVTLCAAGSPFGARWQGDRIVFSIGDRILSVPDTAGAPETLVSPPEERRELRAAPAGRGWKDAVVHLRSVGPARVFNESQIVVQPIGGARRVLVEGGTDGRVFPRVTCCGFARARCTRRRSTCSRFSSRAARCRSSRMSESPQPGPDRSRSRTTGRWCLPPVRRRQTSDLIWVDRSGHEEPTGAPPQAYTYPRVSPDGTKIVLSTTEGDPDSTSGISPARR